MIIFLIDFGRFLSPEAWLGIVFRKKKGLGVFLNLIIDTVYVSTHNCMKFNTTQMNTTLALQLFKSQRSGAQCQQAAGSRELPEIAFAHMFGRWTYNIL